MTIDFLIPAKPCQYEIKIKRSRFIAHLAHADNRQNAEQFITQLRKQYPQSRHVCWAYIAGPPDTTIMSMSDDGEPSGTAGRPILNILKHSKIGEIVAGVVRYFGGIKLGTGGLQRAYSNVVSEAIQQLTTCEKITSCELSLQCPFALESMLRHLLAAHKANIQQYHYTNCINMHIHIPSAEYEQLLANLNQRSNGKISINKI